MNSRIFARQTMSVLSRHLMLAGTAFCLVTASPTFAQTTDPASGDAARGFNIPPQPLRDALRQLMQQGSLQIAFEAADVDGRTSSAVSGTMSAGEALSRLLAGTGLTFRYLTAGSVVIEPAPQAASGAVQLGPVRVEGNGGHAAFGVDPGVTEGTASYTTRSTNTATKLPLSPRETPQTVTIVTRQQMDDFAMANVDDVLDSVSGVHVFQRGGYGAFYYSRGFAMQTQYDGLANPIGIGDWNANPSPDSAFLDRTEVLQGASGLLSGAGEPGGTINLVRKRPTPHFQAEVQAQLGSWEKRRVVGDVSIPLLESGAVRARAVGVWDDSESFVDYVYDDKRAIYGVIEADLTPTTLLSGSVQYQRNDNRNHVGVPMAADGGDLHFRRSSFFGNAQSENDKEYALYTLGLEQGLGDDWILKAAYSYNRTNVDIERGSFLTGGPLDAATGDGLRIAQHRYLTRRFTSKSYDAYVRGTLGLFGRRHEIVLGTNGATSHERSRNSGNVQTPINVYDFDAGSLPEPAGSASVLPPSDETRQYGVYGVARLSLADPLKLIIGTRATWYRYTDSDGVRTHQENAVVSPYAGIVYDIDANLSVYASYSDIFLPQSNLDSSGRPIEPVVGSNYEFGIKGEFHDGRLNMAASVFRLVQTNLPKIDEEFGNDPTNICGGWCYIAQDKVVSQGFDLSVAGEVLPGWNMNASYTWSKSEYDSGELEGDPYRTEVPKHLLRISSSYRIPGSGWTIGGTFGAQSRFYSAGVRSGIAWRVEQGSLATVDILARYDLGAASRISFNIDNLFDKHYFASTNSLYYVPYGEPRRFTVGLSHRF